VDSTDPQGPGKVLFSHKFYAACRRCMTEGGVMVTQNGVPILQPGELKAGVRKFRKLFAEGTCFIAAIPTYVGGHMAMGWATDNTRLRTAPVATIARRYERPAASPPGIGPRKCMPPLLHCRDSSRIWSRVREL